MPNRVRTAVLVVLCAGIGFAASGDTCFGQVTTAQTPPSAKATHPFFAFCFDIPDEKKRDLEQQAAMLKQLGFDGAGHVGLDTQVLAQRVESLDRAGLRLCLAGMAVDLSKSPDEPLQQVEKALPLLKDRGTLIYITLTGYPPRDARGEQPGVNTLRALADLAARGGVRIAIYPHTSDWVAEFGHAVTVANQVDRPNCGVIFNLCHFLENEDPATMPTVLRHAQERLMAVTLNGADVAGTSDADWGRLIQPLDQGTYDVPNLLRELKRIGYRGPIGLMCYGIPADAASHLTRSIARWQEIRSDLE